MKLYAISDLHISYAENREALSQISVHPFDWLIVAGDIGESEAHFHYTFSILSQKFAKVIWTPGNHDLWCSSFGQSQKGEERYKMLVEICHLYNVVTPEDPYLAWEGEGTPCWIVPMMLLYDYSFRPKEISLEEAIPWAYDSGLICKDEYFLSPYPYSSVAEWSAKRCAMTYERICALPKDRKMVLINHYPLLPNPLKKLSRIPRFSIWCGTSRTQTWHIEFPIEVVVYGHLHIRSTDFYDGVRFEEVSLGYPKHWNSEKKIDEYLREILPWNQQKIIVQANDRT